jgi:manganese efflux pump family protein
MPLLQIAAIAVALAMDAFAVSIAAGISLKQVNLRQTLRLSWHFGLFQAMMPIIGWAAGMSIRSSIQRYDHWVAFGLLSYVGISMLREAFQEEDDKKKKLDPTRGRQMVILSVATSIDALAVGLSISLLNVSIWAPALIIGLVAGVFTAVGMHIGKAFRRAGRLGKYAEILGGLVLLSIGVRILYEHGALGVPG